MIIPFVEHPPCRRQGTAPKSLRGKRPVDHWRSRFGKSFDWLTQKRLKEYDWSLADNVHPFDQFLNLFFQPTGLMGIRSSVQPQRMFIKYLMLCAWKLLNF